MVRKTIPVYRHAPRPAPRSAPRLDAPLRTSWEALIACENEVRRGTAVYLGAGELAVTLPRSAHAGQLVSLTLFYGGSHNGIGEGVILRGPDPHTQLGTVRLWSLANVERLALPAHERAPIPLPGHERTPIPLPAHENTPIP